MFGWDGLWEQPAFGSCSLYIYVYIYVCKNKYISVLLLLEAGHGVHWAFVHPVQPSMRFDSCLLLGVIIKHFP